MAPRIGGRTEENREGYGEYGEPGTWIGSWAMSALVEHGTSMGWEWDGITWGVPSGVF
jgi:hypothetical protein